MLADEHEHEHGWLSACMYLMILIDQITRGELAFLPASHQILWGNDGP